MLSIEQVNHVVEHAAAAVVPSGNFARALSEATIDSEGHEALQITIVLKDDAPEDGDGRFALDTIIRISDELQAVGEQRFPITYFVTEAELADDADPES